MSKAGLALKYQLMCKNIEYSEIDGYIISSDIRRKGKGSILEIVSILMKDPFAMPQIDDAINIARYIVEDNSESKIMFDESRSIESSVVKTVLKNLVGKYSLF